MNRKQNLMEVARRFALLVKVSEGQVREAPGGRHVTAVPIEGEQVVWATSPGCPLRNLGRAVLAMPAGRPAWAHESSYGVVRPASADGMRPGLDVTERRRVTVAQVSMEDIVAAVEEEEEAEGRGYTVRGL